MSEYYSRITDKTSIRTRQGRAAIIPIGFRKSSALIISRSSFLQLLIQKILYTTHGPEIQEAITAANDNASPKKRMEYLCSIEYGVNDEVLSTVFSHAQKIFEKIYELRNVLAHEVWMSCDEYRFKVLFSSLKEEERLQKTISRLRYDERSTSREVSDAITRYIGKTKVIGCEDLERAIRDIKLCEWILMTINHIHEEEDSKKKSDLKMTFLTFRGTSHLFKEARRDFSKIHVHTSNKHRITR